MKVMAAVAVSIPLLLAETAHTPLCSITAVRHWTVGDVTRVAIEVSGQFEFRSDRLHNPERVYFDILNARLQVENRRVFTQDLNEKLLKRLRLAETARGVTRIVLDLGDAVEAVPSQLTNPNRLIIELRVGTPPAVSSVVSSATPDPPLAAPKILPPAPKLPAAAKPEPAAIGTPDSTKAIVVSAPAPAQAEPSKAQLSLPPSAPLAADVNSAPLPAPAETKPQTLRPQDAAAASAPPTGEVAKSARHNSTGQSSLIRALGLKINRVVIDPGHGGHDQGTSGAKGLLEKDLVLDVSTRLGKLIEERMRAEVIYTRTDDSFVPLEGRTALANDKKADLFLSIHANSSPASHVSGIETYYLNFTDSEDALDVASRENASSQKSIFELRDLIQKITLHDKAEESHEFAARIQTALYAFSTRNFPGEKDRGVRKAPFVVLIGANMPSVLAEIGFLSNPKEEALLKKPDYRQRLAEALFRGVSRYAEGLSHFQMALN
ncbi:MAG: N-acetylmuramoyl-L-alanine amidase [Acidobacteriia bacterium]|nr:N-acetylmuramoyl-L-alanine amidase [Terriglobia bacterium]